MIRAGIALVASLACCAATAAADAPLELTATIPLPGVKGRIDHLFADLQGHRVFIAALRNNTVEVIDAQGGAKRLTGFGEPQGVAFAAETNHVFVANGSAGRVDMLDGTSLATVQSIEGLDDADNVRYDESARTVIVGYGDGGLAFLDAQTGRITSRVELPAHPESFRLAHDSPRIFVNVPRARKIVVVDRSSRSVVASWNVEGATDNYAMALDETNARLFVATRSPAKLIVFDTRSGKEVTRMPVGGDVDDLFYDAAHKRVYAICGEGRIDVVRQDSPDRYKLEASIPTAARARTGLFVPTEGKLYVAAPADGATPARILVYLIARSPAPR